jgi:hypothetical protein
MTEQHIKEIEDAATAIVAAVPKWFGARLKALNGLTLVRRALTDLNRLADAAEKSVEPLGSEMVAGIVKALPEPEREKLLTGAWGDPAVYRQAVSDYAAWLTTRPGDLTIGVAHDAAALFATLDEYAKVKGWQP